MNPALHVSKTGLQAQETKLQVIANNLANVNTTGFKRDSAVFEDQFYEMARLPGSNTGGDNQSLSGMQLGTGVRFAATHKEFSQGKLQTTGNETDLAINGNGFFQVTLPSGDIAYTRAGNLGWNSDGILSLNGGLGAPLEPEITKPEGASNVSISATGQVSALVDGEMAELGTLTLATFMNPAGLMAMGENLYLATDASGEAATGEPGEAGFGQLMHKALETSNVVAVNEMVDMIAAQRSYEMNTKVLSAADDMMRNLAQAV